MFVAVLFLMINGYPQGVSINTTNSPPDGSAMLDVSSVIGGMLVPRMGRGQRNAIPSPATGLLIYQTNFTTGFYHYDGASWKLVGADAFSIDDLLDGKTISSSVFLGADAGLNEYGADYRNVALGVEALKEDTTGQRNTAVGFRALWLNSNGNHNTANGYQALLNNTVGSRNTAFGYQSSVLNTTGEHNTTIGHNANFNNEEGSYNTIIGYQAGMGSSPHNKSGNVLLGYQAGYNETGDNKLYINNSDSPAPLIYGEFDNNILGVNGRMGIGTQSPHTSAALDVESNSEGLLPPRLTNIQRDAISSPAAGLFIFNTDENVFQFYDGTAWQSLNLTSCLPSQPGTITGNAYPECNQAGVPYSIGPVASATNYNWTVPTGASLASGQGTTSVTVDFGTSGGNVSVRAENGCGNSAYTDLAVSVAIPSAPGTITGNANPECNETGVSYSIDPVAGATNYNWTIPPGSTGAGGQGTTSILVDYSGATSGNVRVRAENVCGNSAYTVLAVTVAIPSTPGSITGKEYAECNETGVAYSIDAVPGATDYTWTVPTGATIASGQGTTGITVNFGTSSGNVSVRAENDCGSSAYADLGIIIGIPPVPGFISGNSQPDCDESGLPYSISSVAGATYYTWTVPTGATITSGQGTSDIIVDFSHHDGNVSVRAENSCGNSTYKDKAITFPGIPPVPGSITGETNVCVYQTGVIYEIDPVPGATSYIWTVPIDASFTVMHAGIISVDFGTQGGNVSVSAVNSCGTSYPPRELLVTTDWGIGCNYEYEGGIIFYISSPYPDLHGLVCAEVDQVSSAEWGCTGTTISMPANTDILDGKDNTFLIVNECTETGIAARICHDLILNGYDDWFLPAKDGLDSMYVNLHQAGFGGFSDTWYWSSSQEYDTEAWSQYFDNGSQSSRNKDNQYHVRCVREF